MATVKQADKLRYPLLNSKEQHDDDQKVPLDLE